MNLKNTLVEIDPNHVRRDLLHRHLLQSTGLPQWHLSGVGGGLPSRQVSPPGGVPFHEGTYLHSTLMNPGFRRHEMAHSVNGLLPWQHCQLPEGCNLGAVNSTGAGMIHYCSSGGIFLTTEKANYCSNI